VSGAPDGNVAPSLIVQLGEIIRKRLA